MFTNVGEEFSMDTGWDDTWRTRRGGRTVCGIVLPGVRAAAELLPPSHLHQDSVPQGEAPRAAVAISSTLRGLEGVREQLALQDGQLLQSGGERRGGSSTDSGERLAAIATSEGRVTKNHSSADQNSPTLTRPI